MALECKQRLSKCNTAKVAMNTKGCFSCCFYYYYTGTPNHRMFPNTPEESQMVFSVFQKPFWLLWSYPKNCLSVRMSQENFGRHERFRWLFRLIRKCQLHLRVRLKVRGHEVALLSFRKFEGTFRLYTESFRRPFFLPTIAISWY